MTDINDNLLLSSDELEFIKEEIGLESTPLEWLWRVAEGGDVGDDAMADFSIDHTVPAVRTTKAAVDHARRRNMTKKDKTILI